MAKPPPRGTASPKLASPPVAAKAATASYVYSYASASSTGRREARRAGSAAAMIPATVATTANAIREPIGSVNVIPIPRIAIVTAAPSARRYHAGHRADLRGHDALVADHAPRLAAGHPDRPQHPDLARALHHESTSVLTMPNSDTMTVSARRT